MWVMLSNEATNPSYEHETDFHGFFPPHPAINASPQAFFVVDGEQPRGVETRIKVEYGTQAPECSVYTLSALETGRKDPQEVSDTYTIPSGTTRVHLHIALDKYHPGKCDWQPAGIMLSSYAPTVEKAQRGWSVVAHFSSSGTSSAEATAYCGTYGDSTIPQTCSWPYRGELAKAGSQITLSFGQFGQSK